MSHTVRGDFLVQKAIQLDWFELAQVTRTACRGSLARTRCTRCWATSVSSDCCGFTHCSGTTTRPSRSSRTSTSTRRSGGLALASLWEAISPCLVSCGFCLWKAISPCLVSCGFCLSGRQSHHVLFHVVFVSLGGNLTMSCFMWFLSLWEALIMSCFLWFLSLGGNHTMSCFLWFLSL